MANVFIEESTMQAIGDAIRAKTGGTEGILPEDMPAEIESIEAGDNFYDAFWDVYQDNGNRTNYENGFGGIGWTDATFKPKYDLKPTNAYMMFRYSTMSGNLTDHLNNLGITLDLSACTRPQYMFANIQFTRLGKLEFPVKITTASNTAYLFAYNYTTLKTIDELHFNPESLLHSTIFSSCSVLNNIGYTETDENGNYILGGVSGIGDDAITLTGCQQITKHSLLNILNGLVDYSADSSISKTLKIGSTNLAKLEENEIAELATAKGWSVIA